MRNPLATKILSAVAVGVVLLGLLSPIAAGQLVCIGDERDPDCCDERDSSDESRLEETTQLLDSSDCGCCIPVVSAPATAGAGPHKAPLGAVSEAALVRDVAVPTGTRFGGVPTGDNSEASLSSRRTVVLLI
ncbi:MAG: hypothetical protein OES25_07060 [Acidobacteriota bacterium]|nr:hypothetical protein [Acidobacteriota bacterium]